MTTLTWGVYDPDDKLSVLERDMGSDGRRDIVATGVLWAILTALGEWAVLGTNMLPTLASRQGEEVDGAFRLLMIYSVPVMALVLAVLFYSVARWRVETPEEDGPPIADHKGFSRGWFIVSSALALLLFIHPGLTGLLALAEEAEAEPDLVVELTAVQWHWDVSFPEHGVTMENPPELVLPVGATIRFDLTSTDVIHAFWVPAFRLKQDAIPGQTNSVTITPTEVGSYGEDDAFRLQCAELCGTGHARMFLPVRVVEQAEFQQWLSGAGMGPMEGMEGMDMGEGDDMGEGGDGMDMSGDGDGMKMGDEG